MNSSIAISIRENLLVNGLLTAIHSCCITASRHQRRPTEPPCSRDHTKSASESAGGLCRSDIESHDVQSCCRMHVGTGSMWHEVGKPEECCREEEARYTRQLLKEWPS